MVEQKDFEDGGGQCPFVTLPESPESQSKDNSPPVIIEHIDEADVKNKKQSAKQTEEKHGGDRPSAALTDDKKTAVSKRQEIAVPKIINSVMEDFVDGY